MTSAPRFRPNVFQQAIRALLHTLQFAVAYFVMLLAMYYNGYIIICIFIGAYIGYFMFGYESFNVSQHGSDRMQENATVCCG
jgi:copper transporter 1